MLTEQQIIKILNTSITCMQKISNEDHEGGKAIKTARMIGSLQATFLTLSAFTDNQELKQSLETINKLLDF